MLRRGRDALRRRANVGRPFDPKAAPEFCTFRWFFASFSVVSPSQAMIQGSIPPFFDMPDLLERSERSNSKSRKRYRGKITAPPHVELEGYFKRCPRATVIRNARNASKRISYWFNSLK